MNRIRRNIFFAGLAVFPVFSCDNRTSDSATVLHVDLDRVAVIDVSAENTVLLDSTCLVGNIDQVAIEGTLALIKTAGKLLGFDLRTGERVAQYSRKGRALGEYLTVWSMGLDEGMVYLYDMNSKKVMYFDISGNLLKQVPVAGTSSEKPFQDFVRSKDGHFVGKRVFGIGEIPELSVYDEDFQCVADIDGFCLRSGARFGYPFFRNAKGDIYYVRSMLNDIYVINGSSADKVYSIDFGASNIPSLEKFEDEMEIISYANRYPDRYATFVSNIYDSENYFCFMFFARGKKMYAVYDKISGKVFPIAFNKKDHILSQIITYDDKACLFWESESGSVGVTILPVESCL